jgi:hypothetical protein
LLNRPATDYSVRTVFWIYTTTGTAQVPLPLPEPYPNPLRALARALSAPYISGLFFMLSGMSKMRAAVTRDGRVNSLLPRSLPNAALSPPCRRMF